MVGFCQVRAVASGAIAVLILMSVMDPVLQANANAPPTSSSPEPGKAGETKPPTSAASAGKALTPEDQEVLERLKTTLVDLDRQEESAHEVGDLLGTLGAVEILFTAKATGDRKVTLVVREKPVSEAFEEICRQLGMTYVIRDRAVLIGKASELRNATAETARMLRERLVGAVLRIVYDDASGDLTLVLKNVGQRSFLADKDLVFLVNIELHSADGDVIGIKDMGNPFEKPPAEALRSRFVEVEPGHEIQRRLNLYSGFAYFQWGYSTEWNAKGVAIHRPIIGTATPAEYVVRYGKETKPSQIRVEYCLNTLGAELVCLRNYVGYDVGKSGLLTKHLSAVVDVAQESGRNGVK